MGQPVKSLRQEHDPLLDASSWCLDPLQQSLVTKWFEGTIFFHWNDPSSKWLVPKFKLGSPNQCSLRNLYPLSQKMCDYGSCQTGAWKKPSAESLEGVIRVEAAMKSRRSRKCPWAFARFGAREKNQKLSKLWTGGAYFICERWFLLIRNHGNLSVNSCGLARWLEGMLRHIAIPHWVWNDTISTPTNRWLSGTHLHQKVQPPPKWGIIYTLLSIKQQKTWSIGRCRILFEDGGDLILILVYWIFITSIMGILVYWYTLIFVKGSSSHLSNEKKPYLFRVYRGWNPTQLYIYNVYIYIYIYEH